MILLKHCLNEAPHSYPHLSQANSVLLYASLTGWKRSTISWPWFWGGAFLQDKSELIRSCLFHHFQHSAGKIKKNIYVISHSSNSHRIQPSKLWRKWLPPDSVNKQGGRKPRYGLFCDALLEKPVNVIPPLGPAKSQRRQEVCADCD